MLQSQYAEYQIVPTSHFIMFTSIYTWIFANSNIGSREPHFAQASRQMIERGNYWQINFQHQPRHLKPPGIYWLQSGSVNLFSTAESTNPWPYRLPSVLGALLAVLLTFTFARRVSNDKTALLAAVLLACSLLLIIEAHLALTDAVLLATMVAMQYALSQIYCGQINNGQPRAWVWPFCFWVAMAAGVLIKGITPIVAGLTILGLLAFDRRTAWLKGLRFSWGLPLFLLLSLSWLIPFSLASGHNFLWDMIRGDLLPKLAGNQQSHGMSFGYFTLILTAAFWPGSLFIVPAGLWAWRQRQQPIVRFLMAWILSNWIFFEIVHTKLPEYVLPVYPAIVMLVAMALTSTEPQPTSKWVWLVIIVQQILWVICSLAFIAGFIYLGGWGWLAAVLIMIASIYLLFIFYHPTLHGLASIGVVLAVIAFIPIWLISLPNLHNFWLSTKVAALTKTVPDAINATHPLLVTAYQEPSLVFLLGTDRVVMSSLIDAIIQAKQSGNLLLVSQRQLVELGKLGHQNHFTWQSLGTTDGIQYNKTGKNLKLYLIQINSRKL